MSDEPSDEILNDLLKDDVYLKMPPISSKKYIMIPKEKWEAFKQHLDKFPKPHISTDYTAFFEGDMEALDKSKP